MGNMAPETAYQGSKGMKRVERSKADKKSDKGVREGSKRDKAEDEREAKKTLLGEHKTPRVRRGGY